MPLDVTAVGRIVAKALGALADRAAEHRSYQLALKINATLKMDPSSYGYTSEQGLFNAVWSVVRQASAAQGAGAAIHPDSRLNSNPPRIPGIAPDAPEFSYRVVVYIKNPGGDRISTLVEVRSDTPLDYDQIKRAAVELVMNSTPQWGETPGRQRVQDAIPTAEAHIAVLSAGRR